LTAARLWASFVPMSFVRAASCCLVTVVIGGASAGCACDAPSTPRDAGVDAARVADAPEATPDAAERPDAARRPDAGRDAAGLGAPYPIVLAHGFFGFDDFAGIDFIDYFWEVKADLAANGETRVYTPAVDPFNDSEMRGRELLAHIEDIVAETGHERVNIIAHSQGGLDARVVATLRPDLVASITTISTPHAGTPAADVILRIVEDPRLEDLIDAIVRLAAAPLWDAAGGETSLFAPLRLFSREGIAAFEAMHPDEPSVQYFSIAGRSDRVLAPELCRVPDRPEFLRRYDSVTDPVEPLLLVSEAIIGEDSDGLVPVASARRGRFLGCIPADHMDEIGHLFGDDPGLFNDFDHRRLYRDLIAFLRERGL
jgi:triacylglycerol lipase